MGEVRDSKNLRRFEEKLKFEDSKSLEKFKEKLKFKHSKNLGKNNWENLKVPRIRRSLKILKI